MIVTIAYGKVAFSAGPFCDLTCCDTVTDIYVGF